jgi:hypothetical protein
MFHVPRRELEPPGIGAKNSDNSFCRKRSDIAEKWCKRKLKLTWFEHTKFYGNASGIGQVRWLQGPKKDRRRIEEGPKKDRRRVKEQPDVSWKGHSQC